MTLFAVLVLADPPPPGSPGSLQAELPQITVEAERASVEAQVRAYVSGSLSLENDESAARWNSPVCPTVVGLSREQGEFLLARLSEIARTVNVPLDGPDCKPSNLLVIATNRPSEFLRQWGNRSRWQIFAGASRGAIDGFVASQLPVRVWTDSRESSETGAVTSNDFAGSGINASVYSNDCCASRLTRNVQWSLTFALVVVDKTQIAEVKIGQLADYIGMFAYARLKEGAPHGSAPTILSLFEAEPVQSPAGLTAWDEALLKVLYQTDPKVQQQTIVSRMVSHIVQEAPH